MPGRLEIIAALLLLGGLLLCGRGVARLVRSIRARFTYGAPYRTGTIADRALALGLELPIAFAGAALLFLAIAQSAFHPCGGTVRVGRIDAARSSWASITVRLAPDPSYPRDRVLEGEVSGARWAVVGDFLTWHPGIKWLGFRDGHRVRWLLGSNDTTGTSPEKRSQRVAVDVLPDPAARLERAARFLPFLKIRSGGSPWFPIADRQIMNLYAVGTGYLADAITERGDDAGARK